MTTYLVDSLNGSDSYTAVQASDSATPWFSLVSGPDAHGKPASDDQILRYNGAITAPEAVDFSGIDRAFFGQGSASLGTTHIQRGGKFVTTSWSVHSGNTYKTTIGTGLAVIAVASRRATRVDSTYGFKYGFAQLCADPSAGALGPTTGSITGSTTANPAVGYVTVTSAAHGLKNGDTVVIAGSNSTPSINGTYSVLNVATNTFDIQPAVIITGAGTAGTWTRENLDLWYYNSGTGVLYMQLADSSNPGSLSGDDRAMYCSDASVLGVAFTLNGHGNVVSGGQFEAYMGSSSPVYELYLVNGGGNAFVGVAFYDGMTHQVVVSGPGPGNTIANCRFYLCDATPGFSGVLQGAAYNVGAYSNTTDVVGLEIHHNTGVIGTARGATGAPLTKRKTVGPFYIHTGRSGQYLKRVRIHHNDFTYLSGEGATTLPSVANTDDAPSDVYNFNGYPVQFEYETHRNAMAWSLDGNVGIRRSFIDLTNAGAQYNLGINNPGLITITSRPALTGPPNYDRAGSAILLESCVIVYNTDHYSALTRSLAYLSAGTMLTCLNCTFINLCTAAVGDNSVFRLASTAAFALGSTGWRLNLFGNIFAYATAPAAGQGRFLVGDSGMTRDDGTDPTKNIWADGNVLWNFNSGFLCDDANFNTVAKFTNSSTGIDRNADTADPGFLSISSVSPTLAGILSATSGLRSKLYVPPKHAVLDIDGRRYSGRRGARQREVVVPGRRYR